MKTAGKTAFVVLALILVGLGFIYFVPGYNLYLVRSESMEPSINMGDLIITGPAGELQEGKVITFDWHGELVTHRIYSVDETGITTKGDAVEDPDPWTVKPADVKGNYLFKIPWVGYVTRFVQTRTGWIITIIVPAMLLVGWLAKDIVKEALSDA